MQKRMGLTDRLRAAGRLLLRGQLDAAGGGRRWRDERRALDAGRIVHADASTIAARAAAFVLNNPHGMRIVEILASNLIGAGITPRPMHPDEATRRRLVLGFQAWTDTADAEARMDHYGQQAMMVRDLVTFGEGLGIWLADPITAAPQMRRLHPEQLDRSKTMMIAGGAIVQGVELNAAGRIVAYHIRPSAPGDQLAGLPLMSQRVPAADVVHLFRPLFPGQMRGLSWFAPILLTAHELSQLFDAMLVRARVATLMTGFVKISGDDAGFGFDGAERNGSEVDVPMEPGAMINLAEGESIDFSEPPDPGNVAAFATEFLRMIAAGVGVTYEALTGDYSRVSYSSARAALLEFRRFAEGVQHHTIVFQLCRPTWERFIRWQVLLGAVPALAYQRDRAAFHAIKWLPPAWPWVDPLKDAQAAVLEINNLLRSRSEVVSERGYDVESLDTEIAADGARADRLGIAPETTTLPQPEKEPADA